MEYENRPRITDLDLSSIRRTNMSRTRFEELLLSTQRKGIDNVLLELEKTGVSVACGGAAVSKAFVNTFRNALYTKSPLETVHAATDIINGSKKWEDFRS